MLIILRPNVSGRSGESTEARGILRVASSTRNGSQNGFASST